MTLDHAKRTPQNELKSRSYFQNDLKNTHILKMVYIVTFNTGDFVICILSVSEFFEFFNECFKFNKVRGHPG